MTGDVEEFQEFHRIENADPAYADAFAAGGEPEVLDRADGRVERCLRHGLTSEPVAALAPPIAKDAEVLWSFEDSLELEIGILFGPLAV